MVSIITIGILCTITFQHDHRREDETLMEPDEFQHELYINGERRPMKIGDKGIGIKTTLQWWENGEQCPPCEQIKMKTIDSDGLSSVLSDDACPSPAKPPELCQ